MNYKRRIICVKCKKPIELKNDIFKSFGLDKELKNIMKAAVKNNEPILCGKCCEERQILIENFIRDGRKNRRFELLICERCGSPISKIDIGILKGIRKVKKDEAVSILYHDFNYKILCKKCDYQLNKIIKKTFYFNWNGNLANLILQNKDTSYKITGKDKLELVKG